MAKVAQKYLKVEPWSITEKGFHPEYSRVSESLFSIGNEFMGVRGYFEEGYGGNTLQGSYFNGIFEEEKVEYPQQTFKGFTRRMHYLINAVDWLYTRIFVDGESLDLAASQIKDFSRTLDFRTGTMTRCFTWVTRKGEISLKFERFTSLAKPNFGGQRITLTALNSAIETELSMGLDFGTLHEQRGRNMWPKVTNLSSPEITALLGQTQNSGHRVFSSMRLHSDTVFEQELFSEGKVYGKKLKFNLEEGIPVTIDRIVYNLTGKDANIADSEFTAAAFIKLQEFQNETYDSLVSETAAFWKTIWHDVDISIDGDPENEQGLRYCVFQLLQAFHGFDPHLNISAKGLTGEAYWGVAWWDTETYCLPFYLLNKPEAAKNLLLYRYSTLPQACERAREVDCEGARYPMCTIDGTESCAVWQHGDREIHVSAAVYYGIEHYVSVSGDKEFLYAEGIEMLLQICRFYASRGQWSQKNGEFGFWCVMGPDEFHMNIHNNCYTNFMAKCGFEYTLAVIKEMRASCPAKLQAVSNKAGIQEAELEQWQVMAEKMRILKDKKTGVYEQHDGFFDLPHLDCSAIPPTDFPLYSNWAYYRIFRWDMIKQPDVLLMQFLQDRMFTKASRKVNYDYYEPRCSHESSLSPSIHSILAAEQGMADAAYDFWQHAARLDLDNYNRNTQEGLHTTSMAAAWMNFIYGFGGLRTDGGNLRISPTIPKTWNSFSFKINYRETILKITIDKTNVQLQVLRGKPVEISVFGKPTVITEKAQQFPMEKL